MQSVKLHSDKWEWLGDWSVDKESSVGDEVDSEGWEYATTFSSFSIASRRRNSHSLDCVKRRRWLRTRVPTADSIDERQRPLTIFWDVQVLQSGTRRVDVRSGFQIRNFMPFSIIISMCGSTWVENEKFIIEEDQIYNVPLLRASASALKIRPAGLNHEWSQEVSCCLQISDSSFMKDVYCISENTNISDSNVGDNTSPICMRVLCSQKSKSQTVTIAPFVTISNLLPCDFQYRCNTFDKTRDEGIVQSGSTCKLASISLSSLPKISFCVGKYKWSSPIVIDQSASTSDPIIIEIMDKKNTVVLILTMITKNVSATGTLEISLCSKGMLLDRTRGLGVSIWARTRRGRFNGKEDMIRSTTCNGKTVVPSTVIVRASVSSADKLKRKAAVRAAGKLTSKGSRLLLIDNSPRSSAKQDPTAAAAASSSSTTLISNDTMEANCTEENILKDVLAADSSGTNHSEEYSDSMISGLNSVIGRREEHFEGTLKLIADTAEGDGLSESDVDSSDSEYFSSFTEDGDRDGTGSGLGIDLPFGDKVMDNLRVKDFSVQSARQYEITRTDVGDKVYTDRMIRFTHLPTQLRNQLCVRTPCDDKLTRTKNLLQFSTSCSSVILVLIDMRTATSPPKWLLEDGFRRISDQAIACVIHSGVVQETFFGIFGKCYEKNESVFLRGNWCKKVYSMYSVFVLPVPASMDLQSNSESFVSIISNSESTVGDGALCGDQPVTTSAKKNDENLRRMFEEISFDKNYKCSDTSNCWIEGGNGLSLFHAEDNIVAIGLKGGSVWSDDFNIDLMTSSPTGSFEIVDWDSMRSYQLSYSMSMMPGAFNNTQLLTITPR